ncbi:hypothetical protein C8R44DRAFT_547181, partial [Mycena epipterygia]
IEQDERNEDYEEFAEGVSMGTIGFYQISKTLFVCEGWNGGSINVRGHWHHLQSIEDLLVFVCTCPTQDCVHERYMREEGFQSFSPAENYRDDSACKVVLFSREWTPSHETISLFSVATPHRPEVSKARAIVTNQGDGKGSGVWTCSKDPANGSCVHVSVARRYLQQIDGQNETDTVDEDAEVPDLDAVQSPTAVSYLPILPPIWASLPEDDALYPRSHALPPPTLIPLGEHSRCSCGARPTNTTAIIVLDCTLYTLTQAFRTSIEVQMCHVCSTGRRRYVGPDCRELGFFNYNNRTLFSHALFDDYTSAFTSSETPFVAWALVMSRRYLTMASQPFVSANTFRAAWFLFSELQVLSGDMTCPDCGTHPEDTIWDGVTLAFSRKQLLGTLCPPTTVFDEAPDHDSRYVYGQTVLLDADLRKALRDIVSGPSLISPSPKTSQTAGVEGIDDEEERQLAQASDAKAERDLIERIRGIPIVGTRLASLDPALGALFTTYFGLPTIKAKSRAPKVYIDLFVQIAAEESVLQMIPVPALVDLTAFRNDLAQRSRLLSIPAVYNVLKHHDSDESYPAHVLRTLDWLMTRVLDVYTRLVRERHPLEAPQNVHEDDWSESGCYYSMPAIRLRPRYPRLKHDQVTEGSKRGATCSKFYGQYGQQRLTGGIMCVWCTHSICYGFHCIPQGEGRNDVFSAIVTRWPQAPKRVIYDFACALAPYCMTREPQFFAETQFVIDDFHASGHTKCSPAAFLKSYAQVDPRLARINTSAAECGNGGISRIRKGVSYMGQKRAIMFTRVFICIWNRVIIR